MFLGRQYWGTVSGNMCICVGGHTSGDVDIRYFSMLPLPLMCPGQAAQLLLVILHWHGPVDTVSIDLFCTAVNVPLR